MNIITTYDIVAKNFKVDKFKKQKDYEADKAVYTDIDYVKTKRCCEELKKLDEEYYSKRNELLATVQEHVESFYIKYIGRVCIFRDKEYVFDSVCAHDFRFRRINKVQKWLTTGDTIYLRDNLEEVTFTKEIFALRNLRSRQLPLRELSSINNYRKRYYKCYNIYSLNEYIYRIHGGRYAAENVDNEGTRKVRNKFNRLKYSL